MLEYRELKSQQKELQIIYSVSDVVNKLDIAISKNTYSSFQWLIYNMRLNMRHEARPDDYDYLVSKNPVPSAFLSVIRKRTVDLLTEPGKGGYYDYHSAPIREGEYDIYTYDIRKYEGCTRRITVKTAGDFAAVKDERYDNELKRYLSKPIIQIYEKGELIDTGHSSSDVSQVLEIYIKKLESKRVDYNYDGVHIRYSAVKDERLPKGALDKLIRLRDEVIATEYLRQPVEAWLKLHEVFGKQEK